MSIGGNLFLLLDLVKGGEVALNLAHVVSIYPGANPEETCLETTTTPFEEPHIVKGTVAAILGAIEKAR